MKEAATLHSVACDALAQAMTVYREGYGTWKGVCKARDNVRKAARTLINKTYAAGHTPSAFMVGALPYMYRTSPQRASGDV